jgi:hypothetical protein
MRPIGNLGRDPAQNRALIRQSRLEEEKMAEINWRGYAALLPNSPGC